MNSSIRRFSSRRERLDRSFLTQRLQGALAYDRIAGYFCGSILEVAGEALETVAGPIRMVCNSGLRLKDVQQARAAAAGLRQEWCASRPEDAAVRGGEAARLRLSRLYDFLISRKLQIRVLPDEAFGLIHGKAGVITLAEGSRTAFLGSVNESAAGWRLNYELLWEDPSPDAVAWVQEEFDALWTHHAAIPLESVSFILQDLKRIAQREVLPTIESWVAQAAASHTNPQAAAVFVEAPVYRQQVGLWEHQKYFVKLAFDAHLESPGGARFVLADQVGLGKTVQLAMAAELMALVGEKPILVLTPKTLLWQWQGELRELLDLPSAVWDGACWVDENGLEYPASGPAGIRDCPLRIGIVSTGLITAKSEAAELLKDLTYECVILDEAHRARRKNLGEGRENEKPDPNNLLAFLYEISTRTRSLLLATATPVQLQAVEAWDLLDALNRSSETVLGHTWSKWRDAGQALGLVLGERPLPEEDLERWDWVRTPLPPRSEHRDFEVLRRSLQVPDQKVNVEGGLWEKLSQADRQRVRKLFPRLVEQHNPFLRYIVRRSREYLEQQRNPDTGDPYLQPIAVELFGERNEEAIRLPPYLKEAYALAEEFCQILGERLKGSGFLKTLLLRRVGSTIEAGRRTAEKLLGTWEPVEDPEEDAEEFALVEEAAEPDTSSDIRTLTSGERDLLERFVRALAANQERDPKYARVRQRLKDEGWLAERGCIVFSQYYDSARWLGDHLMEDFPDERIAIYAGARKSGLWQEGRYLQASREEIKAAIRKGEIRLLLGTDAASEGLNLQRLGSLINLDLPWNPTRLEQRKGRIQRIAQVYPTVWIYNMRYLGSVEDRVHQLLSERLRDIHALFGQLPDVLEDVWIQVALGEQEEAKKRINASPRRHPFEIRYRSVHKVDWESCAKVLSAEARREQLRKPWR